MNEFAYLIKISPEHNNNRYYRMVAEGDNFRIEMGRIGASPVQMKRPMYLWDETYQKKLQEGYTDRTSYTFVEKTTNSKYRDIPEPSVKELIDSLMHYANRMLDESYTISYQDVNEKMLEDAQELIFQLGQTIDVRKFNDLLFSLFRIIPRKMKSVSEMAAANGKDMEHILEGEQDLLDLMRTKVQQEKKTSKKIPDKTILDDLGLDIRLCTEKENAQIKKFLSSESAHLFKRAFRVHNLESDKKFKDYCEQNHIQGKNIHYLYHGSKNMNYIGIMSEGLKLNPKAPITGKMFGHGLYFAPRAKKSINYTSINGSYWAKGSNDQAFLAVFKVAYKNQKDVMTWEPYMSSLRNIRPHDALFAHAGTSLVNDEIIVYDERQVTLQYLIELEK